MRIALILNPKSGTLSRKEELLADFRRLLEREIPGGELVVFHTSHPGHAMELARNAALKGFEICFAAGGDGTMNEVGRSLAGSDTQLALVPLGSGNGLARHLGISMDPLEAFVQGISGEVISMDMGRINGSPFFLASGIGFEGVVAHRFADKKSRGFIQYLASSLESLTHYSPVKVWGSVDGAFFESEIFTLTVANGSQYGNNARIAPGAEVDDGLLQLIRISPFPIWRGPRLFLDLMNDRINQSPNFSSLPFKELHLESRQELEGHVDGEPVSFGRKLHVVIEPAALRVRTGRQAAP